MFYAQGFQVFPFVQVVFRCEGYHSRRHTRHTGLRVSALRKGIHPMTTHTPTRRTLVKGLAWAAPAALVATSAPALAYPSLPPTAGRSTPIGVTIGSAEDTERALQDIEDVAALGGTGIRLGAGWSELVGPGAGEPGDPLTMDPEGVANMHRILDAARARDMTICFMWINTMHDQSWAYDDWLAKTEQWWEALAREFAAKVDQVQVFNEASGYHYRFYVDVEEQPKTITVWDGSEVTIPGRAEYLVDLASKISLAGEYVHRYNPAALVTTNLYGWPVGPQIEQVWMDDLDVLAEVQDIITLDAYVPWKDWPKNWKDLGRLRKRVARIRKRYRKPVVIGEIGDSVQDSDGSESVQAWRLMETVDNLRQKGSPIEFAFLFTLRDWEPGNQGFGLMTEEGEPKEAYTALLERQLCS